ncbi:MAG: stage II sporulation protein E, partial [Leptospiraceae bacterium]|nr:stage II sporulation protein E [Leptospiraceae bacterium]
KGDRDAIYMMIGILFFMIAIGVDTATHLNYLNIPRILGYVFIMFVLSLSLILANRFVRLSIQVEDLNRNLEKKVEQRTEELRNTLKEVRTLKEQQDGDYFLTSLLVRPLGGDYSRSEFVNVSMVERQKKKFTFRGRNSEIGGDLNLAQDIQLYGRNYTAFLNGDAMGKSMQGAGGALVLGTVFRSILNPTLKSSQMQQRHPEQRL